MTQSLKSYSTMEQRIDTLRATRSNRRLAREHVRKAESAVDLVCWTLAGLRRAAVLASRTNSKHHGSESGSFNPSAIIVTAIAICGITLGAATLRAPAEATPPAAAFRADTGYLPAQIANQAREIEPMPEMYY